MSTQTENSQSLLEDSAQPMRKIGDRYALLALIGTGESAEVYRAKDVLLGVDRALKLLSQPHRSAWRRRFRLEARTMARLSLSLIHI